MGVHARLRAISARDCRRSQPRVSVRRIESLEKVAALWQVGQAPESVGFESRGLSSSARLPATQGMRLPGRAARVKVELPTRRISMSRDKGLADLFVPNGIAGSGDRPEPRSHQGAACVVAGWRRVACRGVVTQLVTQPSVTSWSTGLPGKTMALMAAVGGLW